MNISLRRAAALQNAIQDATRSIKIEPAIQVNEFVNSHQTIIDANAALVAGDSRRVALAIAYYNIRSLVGAANVSCGINMKLATAAFVDKRIAQLEELIGVGARNIEVVSRRLDKIRETPATNRLYSHETEVTTSVLTEDQIAAFRSELSGLRKQKVALNDEILELNIKTEIPLGENTVDTLRSEGLI
jgi:hypothetical protein